MPLPTAHPQSVSRRAPRLAALLLVAALCALASAQTSTFQSDDYGFAFDYPASWLLEHHGVWLESADVHDGVAFVQTVAYGVEWVQSDDELEEALEQMLRGLERRFWEFEVLSFGTETIAGRTVWRAAYAGLTDVDDWAAVWYGDAWDDDDWDDEDWDDDWPEPEIVKRGEVYVFAAEEVVLIVTAEAPEALLDAYRATLDAIVASLRFNH